MIILYHIIEAIGSLLNVENTEVYVSTNNGESTTILKKLTSLANSLADTDPSELVSGLQVLEQLKEGGLIDPKELIDFLEKPYVILDRNRERVKIAIPRFIEGFHPGWLVEKRGPYNVYELTRWMRWTGGIQWPEKYPMPPEIERMVNFEPEFPLQIVDHKLIGPEEDDLRILKKYRQFLGKRESPGVFSIKAGRNWFDLIATLIDDGILPYVSNPIRIQDRRQPRIKNFELWPYQQETFDKFLEYGAIGVFWPFGGGKTFLGLHALASLKGSKLVIVPTRTLKEQWRERLHKFTYISDEVDVLTYHAFNRPEADKERILTIYDECHRLPADMFSRMAAIPTTYRIGLSGTSYREDGRTNYIIALTGYPTGLDWEVLHKLGVFEYPDVTAYVLPSKEDKIGKLGELLQEDDGRTIVFCDSIRLGKELSEKFGLLFVYGRTSSRLDAIRDHKKVIVSRVGDEGLSLPDINRIIEVDFLYGSRRQEAQRVGRLFHNKEGGTHTVLMTGDEFYRYEKRFYGLMERGINVRVSYVS